MKRNQKVVVFKYVENNFLYGNLILVCSAFGGEHWYLKVRKIKENTLTSKIDINKSLKLTAQEVDINSPRLKNHVHWMSRKEFSPLLERYGI